MKRKFEDSLFKTLHRKGNPLVLYNVWDVGSAKIVEKSGAEALATSSLAVANSYGYEDGEKLPLKLALQNLKNIIEKVKVPVSFDFESGFASELSELTKNIGLIVETGAVGINFEDQIIGKEKARYSIEEQCKRIKAVKEAIKESLFPNMFINARTDIFLQKDTSEHNEQDLKEAIERSKAYAEVGADGFFAPGLANHNFIQQLCESSPIPVNIMVQDVTTVKGLIDLGVSRISYGPFPYIAVMQELEKSATEALACIIDTNKKT
ncbi:MAG TPA: isocitrate lyase/phosphoenolpyruvate mutase family protein [Rickettsia endosymbiont of Sericostoma sp.]|uniref:isocitrate lyase/PEP mutase family protein n=1 Tax=Candidatus Tisiphia endosymbiont of Nemotelus uliginosus TaxID=3077926 RepID=UPI001E0323A4|nr:isocitrate lyase/phosphoenolpyruvate mutase family protein [Rickettsia endosymbiont of Sericostoma sp.]